MANKPTIVKVPKKLEKQLQAFRELFTKPSYNNFSNMTSAITACTNSKNLQNLHETIADTCKDKKTYQAYSYFFNRAKWSEDEVAQKKANMFFEAIGVKSGKRILVIIDDTLEDKKGEKTFGVGKFKDHATGEYLWGNQFVTSVIQHKDLFVPHKAKLYVKEENAEKWGVEFKTKLDIAVEEIIQPLKTPEGAKVYVVVDSWYFNKVLVDNCRGKGYHLIGRIKSNWIIIQDDDSEVNVRDYFNEFKREDYRKVKIKVRAKKKTYWIIEDTVVLKSVGKRKVVASKKDLDDEETKYYGSTDTALSGRTILSIYENRWNIETTHRESNQKLGFKDYQMRNEQPIERLIQLIFVAWLILLLLELDKEGAVYPMRLLSEMLESAQGLHFIEMFYAIIDYFGMLRPPLGGLIQLLQNMGWYI